MGYVLHITRQEEWFNDDPERRIGLEEWLEIIANDTSLQLDETNSDAASDLASLPGPTLGIGMYDMGGAAETAFHFSDGNIDVKNPSPAVIIHMYFIADKLGARVIGDDGERYGENGLAVPAEPLMNAAAEPPKKKSWWKKW